MKVLNLYAGIGGNRKLWDDVEVTAVEFNPDIAKIYQDFFPQDKVIIGDAHQYLLDHYKEFDFIWASPPCPTHSRMNKASRHDNKKYPDMTLYQEIIFLKNWFSGKYVVENVIPYYTPLIQAQESGRHLFWANFKIGTIELPSVKDFAKGHSYRDMVTVPKEVLMDYLGIYIDKNIYDGSHDERKVLRNCVHPKLGQYILNCARNIITKSNIKQTQLF
jgi:DNA (cytosine-5)-methyltransferase 1